MVLRRAAIYAALVCALPFARGGTLIDSAGTLPPGFSDTVVIRNLITPTAAAFSSDGRVFIAEKSGIIKVFDSIDDTTATVFADLRTQVHNYGDRGLLGLALDPNFPLKPDVYALYTRDATIGGAAPRWGTAGSSGDPCPLSDSVGCTASGRLSRLRMSGAVWDGVERVLVDGWFQQFNSHSMGAIAFGADGALYASGGEAASWQFVDYGQNGDPPNPGGDPPVPVGGTQTPPTAEGGALRAQDLRTMGDPAGLSGTVIRVHPDTGAALPDNPGYHLADPNARRIVAYGLRNPFRIAVRPGTRELWVGDVGWQDFEEFNVVPDPAAGQVPNFGWPCYDGTGRQPGYDAANLNICEALYAQPSAVTFARYQYREDLPVVSGDGCAVADQSLSGLAFYQGTRYPSLYAGALFFADYTRGCIWMMPAGANGVPDPSRRAVFLVNASFPVDLKSGPDGDLFYVDIAAGTLHRIQYAGGNEPPRAVIAASTTSGPAPLTVAFDGRASSDPEGGTLAYQWDLDGDGAYDDSTQPAPSVTYSVNGTYTVRLRVTDPVNATGTAATTITVGNSAPLATIDTPAASLLWRVGQTVSFSGHATDQEQGALAASALTWSILLNHCSTPTSCHQHPLRDVAGVASGSFTAPDHEYPSFLTIRLTATDAGGLTHRAERRIDPQAVALTLRSQPDGLQLALSGEVLLSPATRTVIVGSQLTLTAVTPQASGGVTYAFSRWSDGGAATHAITAPAAAATYTATFAASATTTLPSPWTARDIGTQGQPGSARYATGTFMLTNSGTDIWDTADGFTYAYRTLTGDGEIVARVASAAGPEAWTKAGVMLRESTAPGAAHAFMLVSTGKGTAFQRRSVTGGTSTHTTGGTQVPPRWLRLVRRGAIITASQSADGVAWTTVGSTTFSMGSTILAGLALTSHTTGAVATAGFDHVRLRSVLPAGWAAQDVGAVSIDGSTTLVGATYTLEGAGDDIWGTADGFQFAYRALSGDGQVTARVAAVSGAQAWTKAGVMIRGDLTASAAHAALIVSTGKGVAFQRRPAAGSESVHTAAGAEKAPRWVRLSRSGTLVTAWVSADGVAWNAVGSDSIALGATAYVGLAVTSHDALATAAGTFDNVSVTAP